MVIILKSVATHACFANVTPSVMVVRCFPFVASLVTVVMKLIDHLGLYGFTRLTRSR